MSRYMFRRFDDTCNYKNNQNKKNPCYPRNREYEQGNIRINRAIWLYSVLTVGYGPLFVTEINAANRYIQKILQPIIDKNFLRLLYDVNKDVNKMVKDLPSKLLDIARNDLLTDYFSEWKGTYKASFPHFARGIVWALSRGILGLSVLDFDNDSLEVSEIFYLLDSTEKGIISYVVGMALTNLTMKEKLDTPWVLYLERFCKKNNYEFIRCPGRKRGDLLGLNADGIFSIIEAKGRLRKLNTNQLRNLFKNAYEQVKDIEIKNTQDGIISKNEGETGKYVSIIWADKKIINDIVDPYDNSIYERIITSPEIFLGQYYLKWAKFFHVIKNKMNDLEIKDINDINFKVVNLNIGIFKISLGLEEEIYYSLQKGDLDMLKENVFHNFSEKFEKIRRKKSEEKNRSDEYKNLVIADKDKIIGRDGIFLQIKMC